MTDIRTRLEEYRKIDSNGCWIWTGFKSPNGYGKINYHNRVYLVHRLAYEIFVCAPTKFVLHKPDCKSRACFNPDHLYEGTQQDNIKDRVRAGRNRNGWYSQ